MATDEADLFNATKLVFECLDQGTSTAGWLSTMALHAGDALPADVAAIGVDTNILKVLRRAPLMTDNLLSYVEDHGIPLIIPGQSAHEYWNNHGAIVRDIEGIYSGVETLKKKILALNVSDEQVHAVQEIELHIERLATEMHDSRRPELLKESVAFWENVMPKARVCNVSRLAFKELAEVRFATKTAPGFAATKKISQALGDFFVWADFLLGLALSGLGSSTKHQQRVVFVTDDDKPDWKASGKPHPVLASELFRLTGHHLQIMGSKEFERTITPT